MDEREIEVSEQVRRKAAVLGKEGERWLNSLGELVEEIARNWQITVGKSLSGGSAAFVAQVTTRDGSPAVLKIALPSPSAEVNTFLISQVALTFEGGNAFVQLLRSDFERRALLLEALGPMLADLQLSSRKQLEIICATLKASWVKVPPSTALMNGKEVAEWHTNFISNLWQQLKTPCSRQAYQTALRFTANRGEAYDPATAVLVHGDAHSKNTLQILSNEPGKPTFKLIDPCGVIAEPACDLGVMMREWPEELLPDPLRFGRERRDLLCRLTGADSEAVWEWGFIQAMSTGLVFLQIGHTGPGLDLLHLAEAWAAE